MEIILTHVNADFDALAAMVAARKLYPRAKLVFSGSQNKNVRDFIALHRDIFDFLDIQLLEKKAVKRLIIVDTRVAGRLGELEDLVYRAGVEIFAFDHHPATAHDIRVDRDFSEPVGATTSILVKILRKKRARMSAIEATLFALGIHEDTGSLTYPTTKRTDAEALTYLVGQKANLDVIAQFLNYPLNAPQHMLLEKLLKTAKFMDINGLKIVLTRARVANYVDSASLLTHKLRDLENADVIFTLLQMEEKIHIIGRSRVDQVEVGDMLSQYGGGGHPQAASAVTKGTTIENVEEQLVNEIRRRSVSSLKADEIMGSLTPRVDISTQVKEAEKIMHRSRETQLPVFESGRVVGFISRRDIEKANHYNLSHAPVKGFMSQKVVTVAPKTPINKIQELMLESEVEKLPVTVNGKTIGIVSRVDVLRSVHGEEYVPGRYGVRTLGAKKTGLEWVTPKRAREKLGFLPTETLILLEKLGKTASENNVHAYLVGGIVRDFLLGVPNSDLDVVVEGDGIAYAKIVAEKLNGKITSHPQFGTAVVRLPHYRIDVASARTEFYPTPAALPQVEFSSIKDDLSRRDFTINAMALALSQDHFGEILDFFGGEKDLDKRFIRVLHERSFVEDPTRIFRAVRFEQRVGFAIEPSTEKWARTAVQEGLIEKLSAGRVRYEVQTILSEDKTWQILKRLAELKVLPSLFPPARVNVALKEILASVDESLAQLNYYFAHRPALWLVRLMALFQEGSLEELNYWIEKLKLRKKDGLKLTHAVFDSSKTLAALVARKHLKASELYLLLQPQSPENLLYLHARSNSKEARKKIRFYLSSLTGVRPVLTGRDLVGFGLPPSAVLGSILHDLLRAKLDNRLRTREAEVRFVKEKIAATGAGTRSKA